MSYICDNNNKNRDKSNKQIENNCALLYIWINRLRAIKSQRNLHRKKNDANIFADGCKLDKTIVTMNVDSIMV